MFMCLDLPGAEKTAKTERPCFCRFDATILLIMASTINAIMSMSKYRQCISIIILFQIMLFRFSLLSAQLHTINIVHSPLGKCHPFLYPRKRRIHMHLALTTKCHHATLDSQRIM